MLSRLLWFDLLLSVGLFATALMDACAPATPTPLPTPEVISLREAVGEGDIDSRELWLSWGELRGVGLEFHIPLMRPRTNVLFHIPKGVDIWVRCRRLNGDSFDLSLSYIDDEGEKDHWIRPHPWRTPEFIQLLIDATWKWDYFYVLDAKAQVRSGRPPQLIISLYGTHSLPSLIK